MFVQVDNRAYDIIESDTEPKVSLFEFEDQEEFDKQGLKVVVGNTVILLYPIEDLAYKILELTEPKDDT